MPIVKYDNLVGSRILELASLGHTKTKIAFLLGITRVTLNRWIERNDLEEAMRQAKKEFMGDNIEQALVKKAQGLKVTENIREWVEEDKEGKLIKRVKKTKDIAPCEKSIQILSKKYAKEFAAETDALQGDKQLTLDINVNALSRRELLELRAKDNPLDYVDAEAVEVVEDSELLPPTKDS